MASDIVPSNHAPVLNTNGELLPEIEAALIDVARGMSTEGAAVKHRVTKERIRRARKIPRGNQLMQRIKREMKLPDRLGKDELLHKIQQWIEKEERKGKATLSELVGAAMQYARLAGYLEPAKLTLQQNTLNVVEGVSFESILQGFSLPAPATESVTTKAIDV